MKTWGRAVALGAVLLMGVAARGWADSAGEPFTFGVISHRSPTLTAQFWNPILTYVPSAAGCRCT